MTMIKKECKGCDFWDPSESRCHASICVFPDSPKNEYHKECDQYDSRSPSLIRDLWNDQADEYNQFDSLDKEEVEAFANELLNKKG